MQEQSVSMIFMQILTVFMIMVLLTIHVMSTTIGTSTTFNQYVNYQIERHGGLTDEAVAAIEDYYYTNGFQFGIEAKKNSIGKLELVIPTKEYKPKMTIVSVATEDREGNKVAIGNKPVNYGDTVEYEYEIYFKPLALLDKVFKTNIRGTATSRVRL